MPRVTWIQPDGSRLSRDVPDGLTLMVAATQLGVPGIVGECGGGLMCATCHVYVEPPHAEGLGQPSALESDMLDITDAPRKPESRLSCQLVAGPDLDGLVLRVPTA